MMMFLRLLCVAWGTALGLAVAQVGVCEARAGSRPQQCQQEWQLATATVMGLGSQLFSLFQQPPHES